MKKYTMYLLFFFFGFSIVYGKDSDLLFKSKKILNYIENHLIQQGTLTYSGGFIHVDLDDTYVHELVSFLEEDGFEEPPYFENGTKKDDELNDVDLVGAHITVMSSMELKKYGIQKINECGQKIPFKIRECRVIYPHSWKGVDVLFILVVDAPVLDQIRKRYGLLKSQYDFHITIGVKIKIENAS